MAEKPSIIAQKTDDIADPTLLALRRRIERMRQRVGGNMVVLRELSDRVTDQQRHSDISDTETRREA